LATDPKATVVALLVAQINQGTYDITEDDGSTLATTLMAYDLPMETIIELFATNDVIISVSQGVGTREWIGFSTIAEVIPINLDIYVIDRYLAGVQKITGAEVRWKAKDAVITMVKAKVTTAGGDIRILKVVEDDDSDITETRPIMYHSTVICEAVVIR